MNSVCYKHSKSIPLQTILNLDPHSSSSGLNELKDLIDFKDRDEEYFYDITFCTKLKDNEYLYVVEETNHESGTGWVDVHYYLKYYKDGLILIDWELESYNPYFGCDVKKLYKNDDGIHLEYREKHRYCKAILVPASDSEGHQDYVVSQPNKYARSQNTQLHQQQHRGTVIEFWKGDKQMKDVVIFLRSCCFEIRIVRNLLTFQRFVHHQILCVHHR